MKGKQMLSLLLALFMVLTMLPINARAAETVASGTCGENLTWVLDDSGTLTISGTGAMEDYSSTSNVPWCSQRASIVSVVIEEGVTSIGTWAFWSCDNLISVTIPKGVTSIGDDAFAACENLSSVAIPKGVTSIGDEAFAVCENLITITFPDSVTSIGARAFSQCFSLRELVFECNAPSFGNNGVFYDVTAVAYYPPGNETWTEEVRQNYGGTISWVENGSVIVIAGGTCGDNLTWELISDGTLTISGSGAVENIPLNTWQSFIVSVVIEDGVTDIGDHAFSGCKSLTSITIPDSVTSIGERAFYGCKSLTNIPILDSVTYIGDYAFYHCENLRRISLPKIRSLGKFVFAHCSRLDSIDFLTSVYSWIPDGTFSGCNGLSSIAVPESITSIGDNAFSSCDNLNSITIPESVTRIGSDAFSSCDSLAEIVVDEDNLYYSSDQYGVLFNKDKTALICCPGGQTDTYTVPPSVTSIGDYAFSGCKSLTDITIPDSVTSIGWRAFGDCRSLTSITIPDSVTSIGGYAFSYCENLSTITISESVTNIGYSVFSYCTGLNSIDFWPSTYTMIPDGTFRGCNGLSSITIPETITSIGSDAFSNCDNLTSVTIPRGVTSIGDSAFSSCNNLSSITIPESVTSIGEYAFFYCESLSSIKIPEGVTSIGDYTFAGCVSLTGGITIPGSVTSIGDNAFSACNSLTSITIPDSVTSIGGRAFGDCRSLTSITIPDSVTSIGAAAFSNCYNLSTITIAESVTNIGSSAFRNCFRLTTITIPESVTRIGSCVFEDCSGLTSITIPESVTSIDDWAFRGCIRLEHVLYTGTQEQWGSVTVDSGNTELTDASVWHYEAKGDEVNYRKDCSGEGLFCTICNEFLTNNVTEGEALGHDYGEPEFTWNDDNTVKATFVCSRDESHVHEVDATVTTEYDEGDCQNKAVTTYTATVTFEDETYTDTKTVEGELGDHADEDTDGKCDTCGELMGVIRLAGSNRFDTAIKVADEMKAVLGTEKFDAIILANGYNFADALAGSYLSAVKNAPILLTWNGAEKYNYLNDATIQYVKDNLKPGGTVYILGGTAAVPAAIDAALAQFNVERMDGANRFETNIMILDEAGVQPGSEVLVCTSTNFADSLSASAAAKPILLVWNEGGKLFDVQKDYLAKLRSCTFTIIGGESAVSVNMAATLMSYGAVSRLAGGNRFETSVLVAEKYFPDATSTVLAYAWDFPDGLCGGALAYSMGAPLILTMTNYEEQAAAYTESEDITSGIVLGGKGLISDDAVRAIFAMDEADEIVAK